MFINDEKKMKTGPSKLDLPLNDNHSDSERIVKLHRHNNGSVSLTIPGNNILHLERFFSRKCVRDIWNMNIYPNLKEVSEAEAMRYALVKKMRLNVGSNDTLVVIVGDGRTPRLGALLAYTTAWSVMSIDPLLKDDIKYSMIDRLVLIREKVEPPYLGVSPCFDCRPISELKSSIKRVVICHPHSHADLNHSLFLVKKHFPYTPISVVAMPCCVRQSIDGRASCDFRYEDLGVWSTKNVIQIWGPKYDSEKGRFINL